ncbi:MAG: bifunctional 4-hydroxy-2-oxoglutarate aldolase/2-dehydro-3-deoxy-phosphogluconate aldolase [Gammaproteobacteria bacterium]
MAYTREQINRIISETGIVPVIRAANAEQALAAAQAVHRGGIRIIEITMTVPGAIRVMEKVAEQLGSQVLLGAGTILDAETARAAILAGAEFLVAPSLDRSVIEMAHRYSKAVLPGALTPTEVLAAWDAGADFVKVFPAGNVGGPKYIKALKGPFPHIELVPTGGVNLETATEFLLAGAAALGVGGELVDAKALAAGRAEVVEENARKFLACVRKARESSAGTGR